jgi:hypothetical protein
VYIIALEAAEQKELIDAIHTRIESLCAFLLIWIPYKIIDSNEENAIFFFIFLYPIIQVTLCNTLAFASWILAHCLKW